MLLSSNDALNAIILGFNGLNLIILLRFLRPCALTGIDAKKRKPQKRFFEISSQPPDDSVWINDTIDVSSLNILGPKKFFAETFKTLYRNLSDNTVMQKLLLYEMSVINETTKRTAETRDIMNLNLIAFYDNLFKPAKINIKAIMANLIGGIYYLILHRRCAKTCTIDFSTQEGEKVFFEWIDFLTDAIFDKLEAYERNRKAAQEMLSDGISEFKICKYMGINKNDLKMLLSNSHRNSRELSKES